jgi:hypothetical protein
MGYKKDKEEKVYLMACSGEPEKEKVYLMCYNSNDEPKKEQEFYCCVSDQSNTYKGSGMIFKGIYKEDTEYEPVYDTEEETSKPSIATKIKGLLQKIIKKKSHKSLEEIDEDCLD